MRSRRMAAAMSALAVVATGLVSAAVVGGAQPAFADCEITEQRPPQQGQQQDQAPQDQNQDEQQDQAPQDQENQGQDQNQDNGQDQDQGAQQDQDQGQNQDQQGQNGDQQQDQQDQNQNDQQGQDQGAQQDQQDQNQGGALVRDPAADPEASAETFGRRDRDRNRGRNRPTPSQRPTGTASPSPSPTGDENDCLNIGPFVTDFVDIRQIAPRRLDARIGRGGSRGSFVSRCGTNGEGHFNPDNFIVAPGVRNGAHHLHDYVGNLSADAFSTDESLEAAGTTCRLGDKSTYFWPVVRNRLVDQNIDDPDRNVGQVLRPRAVTLQFRGNARARVVAMPRFLRVITGDAKAATNGPANARAGWSCSGFGNRVSPDKYPLCPRGSQVLRIMDFPSCWDGQNTDSANHRTHIVFPDQSGACPQGTQPVPQLRMTLAYSVPRGPSFALDAFPEQLHNPITDHGDFVNVMPERLMNTVVNCINRGRRC
ncbi:DUF1996 domain-containing protein [Nonomuraea sp. NPDC048826]|uniref:DUF1996 domain-containing protein n=1 Tax=Nonomuraea sp. NPDC048826 TaxID=3364347 RepID=UPI003717AE13